ncbi:hypothetical protein J437_LFUL016196 [Ladona fulva]|uniref:Uncharacterized protein n=1 Tax=Ladona fulva TaxID=123851 RepID=A0A8K0KI85_LADFU|nr:hypothetical protein J437_LFUL016196 [Ladona fulva]
MMEMDSAYEMSDDVLLALQAVFGNSFEKALELLDSSSSSVTFLRSPSKRYAIQVTGSAGTTYTLFPGINYCPCPAYNFHALDERHSSGKCTTLGAHQCSKQMVPFGVSISTIIIFTKDATIHSSTSHDPKNKSYSEVSSSEMCLNKGELMEGTSDFKTGLMKGQASACRAMSASKLSRISRSKGAGTPSNISLLLMRL